MKIDLERVIEIPESVKVEVEGEKVIVKADGKQLERKFNLSNIKLSKENNKIRLTSKKATRAEGKLIGTAASHIKNMINGMKQEFVYKMEIANVHFPMNVKVEGDKVVIKSFLGEKADRAAKILQDVKVDVKGNQITITSFNKEAAGQTAANIEKATKLKTRDRRIFQDGIFITEKPGRII